MANFNGDLVRCGGHDADESFSSRQSGTGTKEEKISTTEKICRLPAGFCRRTPSRPLPDYFGAGDFLFRGAVIRPSQPTLRNTAHDNVRIHDLSVA
jgi:hypothetical protein